MIEGLLLGVAIIVFLVVFDIRSSAMAKKHSPKSTPLKQGQISDVKRSDFGISKTK